jgi:hypothetical protein
MMFRAVFWVVLPHGSTSQKTALNIKNTDFIVQTGSTSLADYTLRQYQTFQKRVKGSTMVGGTVSRGEKRNRLSVNVYRIDYLCSISQE